MELDWLCRFYTSVVVVAGACPSNGISILFNIKSKLTAIGYTSNIFNMTAIGTFLEWWLQLDMVRSCHFAWYIDALVQDCSNSIANALELLQSCTKPLILWYSKYFLWPLNGESVSTEEHQTNSRKSIYTTCDMEKVLIIHLNRNWLFCTEYLIRNW